MNISNVHRRDIGADPRFSGDGPPGLTGQHSYRLGASGAGCVLTQELSGKAYGLARLGWPSVFRALHDALIEDSLDTAEHQATGQPPGSAAHWSPRVRMLRGSRAGSADAPPATRPAMSRAVYQQEIALACAGSKALRTRL